MDVGGGEVKAKSRRRVGRRWLSLAQPQRLADRDQGDEEKLFTGKERSSKKERQGRWYTTRSRTLTQLLVSPIQLPLQRLLPSLSRSKPRY